MGTTGATAEGRGRTLGDTLSGLAVALGCVLFLGGFGWAAVLYQPYTVPTDSMAPTVRSGDRVLAERIDGDAVRRGDVVVFRDLAWGGLPMVKRVIAVGGDRIACCDRKGQLTIDGRAVEEPYLADGGPASQTRFDETVPSGKLFLLGDERTDSQDSRVHLQGEGQDWAVPRSAVDARVDATAWPPSGLGMVSRPAGFATLPGGVSEPGPVGELLLAIVAGAVLILGGAAHGPLTRRSTSAPHGSRTS